MIKGWMKVGASAAVLMLVACIETVPKADGGTRVIIGPGVALKQMRARANQEANTPPEDAAAKPYERAVQATAGADFDGNDWTPMFQLMEKGCAMTPAHEKLDGSVRKTRDLGNNKYRSLFDPRQLTQQQRSATGKLSFRMRGDHMTMDLPITKGSYHGLPLSGYHRYAGTENGIGGYGLVLGVPLSEAKRRLKHVRFLSEEEAFGQAGGCTDGRATLETWDADRNKSLLLCDASC